VNLLLTLTTAALLTPGVSTGDKLVDKDLQALQGEWNLTRIRNNGKDLPVAGKQNR
jgi:hypothetical protein